MENKLKEFLIDYDSNLILALEKINKNQKNFLVVIKEGKVCGVITDGDIRRHIILNNNLNITIKDIYNSNFSYVTLEDGFKKVVTYFKDSKIKFLPIIDNDDNLINIITKENLHTLLLQNIEYNPFYNFSLLNDAILEHEIYPKPWGCYKTVLLNNFCQCKILYIQPKSSISLQKHFHRDEHWVIIKGSGLAIKDKEEIKIHEGSYLYISKNTVHRLINTSDSDFLILTEVQLGDYFGEDDIIRIKDEYNRINND